MAVEYVDLQCTGAALVRSDNPDTNYHGADRYQLDGANTVPYGTELLLTFESLPTAYHYRRIAGVSLNFTIDRNIPLTVSMTPAFTWDTLESGFDEATVTWNSMPDEKKHFYKTQSASHGTGDEQITIYAYLTSSSSDGPEAGYTALKAPAFKLSCSQHLYGSSYANVYTNNASSGKRPFLRVALSDSNASVSVDEKPVNGRSNSLARFACNKQSTFTWDIALVSGYAYADVIQDSATLYWRRKGTTGWNTVPISGSAQSYTFQENVLPAADIEWTAIPVCGNFNVIASTDYKITAYPRYFAELPMTAAALARNDRPDESFQWSADSINSVYHYTMSGTGSVLEGVAFFSFSTMPDALRRRAIEAATIQHYHLVNPGWVSNPRVYTLGSAFDPSRLTWNNAPTVVDYVGFMSANNKNGATGLGVRDAMMPHAPSLFPSDNLGGNYYKNGALATTEKDISEVSRTLLTAPAVKIDMPAGSYSIKQYAGSIHGTPAPVLVVMLFDSTVNSTVVGQTPTAGWVNPHIAQTFSWKHIPDGDYSCAADWQSASATLFWSADNGSTWHSVAAPANSTSMTLPADTLPVGTIQWYVTATDDQGTTSTSPTYTIITEDSETTATPAAPIQTVEDGREPIVFRWTTANDHGTLPTGADLQISIDGTEWADLGSVTGSATEYTAAADTLPSGTVYWRVRAYNADSVVGEWSAAVSFVSINSPPAPIVSVAAVPFATISWQSDGQQAYRITVDGHVYGPFFGSGKTFTLEDFLVNGGHTVTVEIQGSTGLWSKPGTATFSVLNIPGVPIELSGVFYRDAQLRWTTDSEASDFLIYRDGVQIGHTSGNSFADRTVLGAHNWQVINRLPGGYYTASNSVQGELQSCGTAIALLAGGEWLELKKTDSESSEQNITVSQQISLRHFEGSIYPEAEVSPYIDQAGSYLVAWTYEEQDAAAAFEAMLGRPVILKSRGNECTVGIMAGYAKRLPHFYKSYSFSLQRIHWEDFIDEDD